MKKVKSIPVQDAALLDEINALIGSPEAAESELSSELEAVCVDAEEIQNAVFARLRAVATQKYSSVGRDLPPLMREALQQMRPPSVEEVSIQRTARAASRVQGLLSSLKDATSRFSQPLILAPAYRNKQEGDSEEDEELLRFHQEDLDNEGEP